MRVNACPMALATGGFGADFGLDSLLTKHRPDLTDLPTTNGEQCRRFCNGLGRRDYVTGIMWNNLGLALGNTAVFVRLTQNVHTVWKWI